MKIKTSELIGSALDWAVIEAQYNHNLDYNDPLLDHAQPSTNWAQGGLIIERERIRTEPLGNEGNASSIDLVWKQGPYNYGSTPLITAMRCYVASKLGDEIEIPDELK